MTSPPLKLSDSMPQMNEPEEPPVKKGFSGLQLSLIVFAVMILTIIGTVFLIRLYVFPSELDPVVLNAKEEQRLEQKLNRLGWQSSSTTNTNANSAVSASTTASNSSTPNKVEPYSESDKRREVTFSEKELNALIAGNPDFAKRVAIGLSADLASAKILIPIPEDFPFMPGQILRVNTGLELRLNQARRPVVALKGVNVMGVPIPNAWLGNIKNVDLVSEFGDKGFWKAFADGIDDIQVRDGELYIKLRE